MELQAAILLVVSFALLLMFSVPVSYSIVASAFITITAFLTPQFGMFVSAQKVIAGIDSLSLIAVPFFILAGLLMSNGGIAHRLVDLAMLVLRRVPGALALTNAAGNAMFGSISGSGIAAATAIGGVMLPMEKEEGYDEGFSAAMNVATAPVGQLIPPTTAFIVYSTASGGTSVATLFMAGWIPGLLWTAACMVVGYFIAKKYGYVRKGDKAQKLSVSETLNTIWRAIPSLLLIVIIIGGILSGVFSPTEASAVAVAYAFILSVFIYKSIDLKDMPRILVQTANMTTVVMLIIGASSVLSFVLSFTGLPAAISKMVLGISDNKYVLLLILNIFLLIVGTFMDMAPALLIFTPDLPAHCPHLRHERCAVRRYDGHESGGRHHYPSRWQRPVRGLLSGKAASGERDEESGSVLRGNFHLLDAGHLHSRSERVAAYHAGPDVSPAVQMLVKPEQI